MFDFVITNTYLKRKFLLALAPPRKKYKKNFDELFKNNNNPKKNSNVSIAVLGSTFI